MPIWPSQRDRDRYGPPEPPPSPRMGGTPYPDHDGWPDPPARLLPDYAPTPPARRRRRTVPLLLGGLAAVVLLGAGVAVGLGLAPKQRGPSSAGPAPSSAAASAADPAASSGRLLSPGDCVLVTSTTSAALDNAKLVQQDCAGGFFATVLARVAAKAQCPTDGVLSRISDNGAVLCLGQGDRGTIAKPGDCVRVPTGFQLPLIRTDCAASSHPFRLEAIVDDPAQCPAGTHGNPYSGYDRPLCVRFPDGG
jgi:hypothetical protein